MEGPQNPHGMTIKVLVYSLTKTVHYEALVRKVRLSLPQRGLVGNSKGWHRQLGSRVAYEIWRPATSKEPSFLL